MPSHGRAVIPLPLEYPKWWNGRQRHVKVRLYEEFGSKWNRLKRFVRHLEWTRADWQVRYRFYRGYCFATFTWRSGR